MVNNIRKVCNNGLITPPAIEDCDMCTKPVPSIVYVKPLEFTHIKIGHSEVCMYMGIAGKTLPIQLLENGMVQVYEDDKDLPGNYRKFSAPILAGEAGLYNDDKGYYYVVMPDIDNVKMEGAK